LPSLLCNMQTRQEQCFFLLELEWEHFLLFGHSGTKRLILFLHPLFDRWQISMCQLESRLTDAYYAQGPGEASMHLPFREHLLSLLCLPTGVQQTSWDESARCRNVNPFLRRCSQSQCSREMALSVE